MIGATLVFCTRSSAFRWISSRTSRSGSAWIALASPPASCPRQLPAVLRLPQPVRGALRQPEPAHFRRDDVTGEEMILEKISQGPPDTVLLGRDDRGVRDRNAEGMAEDRRYREPVREAAHQGCFRRCAQEPDPGWVDSNRWLMRKTIAASTRSPEAHRRMTLSLAIRTASSGGGGSGVKDGVGMRAPVHPGRGW